MRRFLLGQLDEAGQEKIELLLLTDRAFVDEFDTVVDELTDQYVRNELNNDERARVEKYFLNTPERQQKLEFATELLSRADAERGERVERLTVSEPKLSWFEQILAFLKQPTFARGALAAAAIVIVGSLVLTPVVLRNFYPAQNVAVELAISSADRATGATPTRVKMPWRSSGLDATLNLPEQDRDGKAYRVELRGSAGKENLTVSGRTDQAIKVTVPSTMLSSGSYVINVFKMKADGIEERVRGSYYLDVE